MTPYSRDLTPASSTTVTADESSILTTLLAAAGGDEVKTINHRLRSLWFMPAAGVSAYIFKGFSAEGKTLIPASGLELPCCAFDAAQLQLFGNGSVDVWQFVQGV